MNADQIEKCTILIVDDNPENLDVLIQLLKKTGSDIRIALSGEEALDRIELIDPDIILLDIMMPGLDGFETCRRLKENETVKGIPVLFISALTEIANKIKGFRAGGSDYITKPFNEEEVLARLNAHLTIHKQQLELVAQKETLRELNAKKDRFFSIISHDLRGPFTGIMGSAELLRNSARSLSRDEIEVLAATSHNAFRNLYKLLDFNIILLF